MQKQLIKITGVNEYRHLTTIYRDAKEIIVINRHENIIEGVVNKSKGYWFLKLFSPQWNEKHRILDDLISQKTDYEFYLICS